MGDGGGGEGVGGGRGVVVVGEVLWIGGASLGVPLIVLRYA